MKCISTFQLSSPLPIFLLEDYGFFSIRSYHHRPRHHHHLDSHCFLCRPCPFCPPQTDPYLCPQRFCCPLGRLVGGRLRTYRRHHRPFCAKEQTRRLNRSLSTRGVPDNKSGPVSDRIPRKCPARYLAGLFTISGRILS